jgi:hypothetical protein
MDEYTIYEMGYREMGYRERGYGEWEDTKRT